MQTGTGRLRRYRGVLEPTGISSGFGRIALAAGTFLGFYIVATLGYWWIEPSYSLWDSVYMTSITVTTVGYEYVHPLSGAGQAWTLFVVLGGVVVAAVALSLVVSVIVEGQIRNLLGRRQLERSIEKLRSHVIVCGYGRMGALVADGLKETGQPVVVVEISRDRIEQAERVSHLHVLGDAQQEPVLQEAGIERASTLVALLPDDAENVFITLSARQCNPDIRIVARAELPSTEGMLRKAGADRVICPKIIGANRMVDVVVRPAVADLVEMAHRGVELELDQLRLPADSRLVGRTLRQLSLPNRIGVSVVAIVKSDNKAIYHPEADYAVEAGDTLVLIGRKGSAAAVQRLEPRADLDAGAQSEPDEQTRKA